MTKIPEDALRYVRETRLSNGRRALESFIAQQRETAVYTAIYGADPGATGVQRGRAQAWTEILNLFTNEKL